MFEEKEDAEIWFWKYDWLKFEDAIDTFEEKEGIDILATDLLIEEEDIGDVL